MNSESKQNSNRRCDFPPSLLRTNTHVLSICQNLSFQSLQTRLNCNLPLSRNITHLNISGNKINKVPRIPFKDLTTLNITKCFLDDNCVIQLEQLLKLDISHNCLSKIPKIKCPKLTYLNVSHNQISTISEQILSFIDLVQLKCNHNQLSLFEIKVLRLPCSKQLDIIKLIDLDRLEDLTEGVYSARYLIERSYPVLSQELRTKLLFQCIRREYQVGINILSESIKQKDQLSFVQFCEMNNLNKSLEQLLISFRINTGFNTCRIESLNPKLFNQDNTLSIKSLLYTLQQNIDRRHQKCQEFICHLANIGIPIITSSNLLDVLHIGHPQIIYLLFKYQIKEISEIELNNSNPHLIKLLLQLDHPQLLTILFKIPELNSILEFYFVNNTICSLLSPKYKIYKLLLKYQKQLLHHIVSKKVFLFKEYQSVPSTNIYTSTPMYSLSSSQQMTEYYRMQDPYPQPAEVIVKINEPRMSNSKIRGKENDIMVTQKIQKMRKSIQSPTKPKKLGLTLRNI